MLSGYFGGAVDRLMVLLMDTLYQLSVLLLSVVLAFLGKVILLLTPTPFVWCVCRSAGSLFVGEVFGVHTRGFIEFAEVAFSISSASPPWAYGRCSDGLGEGLTAQTPGLLA